MLPISENHRSDDDWISESINGGSLRLVDLQTGTNGWASPPGDLFSIRSTDYFTKRQKSPAGDYLLFPAGMDWLKSTSKLENVMAREDNRVSSSLRRAQFEGKSPKSFIFAVNLQIPNKDQYSAVIYFAAEDPIPTGSLLHRFIHGDDAFRNQRFKIVNRIEKGPWIVKKTVGNYSACLLGKTLTCNYHRGSNYFEVDVDIGSSALASAILRLTLHYVDSVTIDMGFVVEAVTEDELPERLIGAIRVSQIEMAAATEVESAEVESVAPGTPTPRPLESEEAYQLGKLSNDDIEEAEKLRKLRNGDIEEADKLRKLSNGDIEEADKLQKLSNGGIEEVDKLRKLSNDNIEETDKLRKLSNGDVEEEDKLRKLSNDDIEEADKLRKLSNDDIEVVDKLQKLSNDNIEEADQRRKLNKDDIEAKNL